MASSMPSRVKTSPTTTSAFTSPASSIATALAIDSGVNPDPPQTVSPFNTMKSLTSPGIASKCFRPASSTRPTCAHQVDRDRHGLGHGRDIEHDVGTLTTGEVAHQLPDVLRVHLHDVRRPDRGRGVEAQAVRTWFR